jgi:hypothetical protein
MSATPEPKDKLGTMVRQRVATVVRRAAVVNGPEDVGLKWDAVNWRSAEDDVRLLRQRIFAASQVGDLKRVRNLQKLMLRSRSNTLVSVRRVAERNAGRLTAGIDGERALTSSAKAALTVDVHRERSSWQARPVRRIYIPKANGKQRPLGIPVLRDRALQARVVNALEPEWEARFEPRSYGFRPGRGCHDAIEAIYWTLNGKRAKRQWVLDADLSAAFDRIDHDRLLAALGTFPARELVRQWLKAGVIERAGMPRPRRELHKAESSAHCCSTLPCTGWRPQPGWTTTRWTPKAPGRWQALRRWRGTPTTSSSCATPVTRPKRPGHS